MTGFGRRKFKGNNMKKSQLICVLGLALVSPTFALPAFNHKFDKDSLNHSRHRTRKLAAANSNGQGVSGDICQIN
jgi:hypothetical protein